MFPKEFEHLQEILMDHVILGFASIRQEDLGDEAVCDQQGGQLCVSH